jgi:hypothetical protein
MVTGPLGLTAAASPQGNISCMRGMRPVGMVPGCITIVCVGLLLATLAVLQGANKIIVGVTGVVFVAFAFYVIVMWLLDTFRGRR